VSALEFLSPDLAAPEAVWRSPLERFLRDAPGELLNLSRLAVLEVRGEQAINSLLRTRVPHVAIPIAPERSLVLGSSGAAAELRSELAEHTVVDLSAGFAVLRLTGVQAMRRLTDLDLDALPAAGPFAGIDAVVSRDGDSFRIIFPQEYGRYVCETVLDTLAGLR
jgi:sarcosine oxidase gamma subunit